MLEFEKPIKNLEDKIEELRTIGSDGQVNIIEEINVLQKKCNILIKDIVLHNQSHLFLNLDKRILLIVTNYF